MSMAAPRRILVPLLGALAALAPTGCSPGGGAADVPDVNPAVEPEVLRLSPESAARHGVAVAAVELRTLRRRLRVPAHVAFDAEHTAHIGCALRGRIAAVPVALGATVRAGDALLVVDSPELGEAQIELLQRRAALASARPRVAFAEQAWLRAKALYGESRGIAEAEVLRREAEHATAAAAVHEAEVAVAAARQRLGMLGMPAADVEALEAGGAPSARLVIRAPFDGAVVARDVTLGELVAPDRDALLVISDTSTLWVLARVPEARLGDIAVGADVEVAHGRSAVVLVPGEVARIAPTVDATTRTAEVRVVVAGGDGALRPGMFVDARIDVSAADAGPLPVVPAAAVQTVDRRSVVFVPVDGEPHAYRMRPVDAGEPADGFVPIRSGLAAGEAVVATGSFVLKALATQSVGDDGGN